GSQLTPARSSVLGYLGPRPTRKCCAWKRAICWSSCERPTLVPEVQQLLVRLSN
ncbi:unnamed protein product, partial [Symbiodinium pilosum]